MALIAFEMEDGKHVMRSRCERFFSVERDVMNVHGNLKVGASTYGGSARVERWRSAVPKERPAVVKKR